MDRVSTGIEELDRKLSGGYPVNKVTLITGIAGSGKTIFGIHFIYMKKRKTPESLAQGI